MSRNRERQQELQPGRVDYARTRLEALGYHLECFYEETPRNVNR